MEGVVCEGVVMLSMSVQLCNGRLCICSRPKQCPPFLDMCSALPLAVHILSVGYTNVFGRFCTHAVAAGHHNKLFLHMFHHRVLDSLVIRMCRYVFSPTAQERYQHRHPPPTSLVICFPCCCFVSGNLSGGMHLSPCYRT